MSRSPDKELNASANIGLERMVGVGAGRALQARDSALRAQPSHIDDALVLERGLSFRSLSGAEFISSCQRDLLALQEGRVGERKFATRGRRASVRLAGELSSLQRKLMPKLSYRLVRCSGVVGRVCKGTDQPAEVVRRTACCCFEPAQDMEYRLRQTNRRPGAAGNSVTLLPSGGSARRYSSRRRSVARCWTTSRRANSYVQLFVTVVPAMPDTASSSKASASAGSARNRSTSGCNTAREAHPRASQHRHFEETPAETAGCHGRG